MNLDYVFFSLTDPTRRDILERIAKKSLSIGELAENYNLTFQAVSKHINVLEKASLIVKHKKGKFNYVQLSPEPFKDAIDYLSFYRNFWEEKLDLLGEYLEKDE